MKPYVEIQRLKQWFIWLPIIVVSLIWLYAFTNQVIFGVIVGSRPASDTELCLIGLLIVVPIWLLFLNLRLITIIDQNTITIKWHPFTSKIIKITEITNYKIIQYDFVGFGWRLGTQYGSVYNCSGNMGIFFKLKGDQTLLLGSKNPIKIIQVLNSIKCH